MADDADAGDSDEQKKLKERERQNKRKLMARSSTDEWNPTHLIRAFDSQENETVSPPMGEVVMLTTNRKGAQSKSAGEGDEDDTVATTATPPPPPAEARRPSGETESVPEKAVPGIDPDSVVGAAIVSREGEILTRRGRRPDLMEAANAAASADAIGPTLAVFGLGKVRAFATVVGGEMAFTRVRDRRLVVSVLQVGRDQEIAFSRMVRGESGR